MSAGDEASLNRLRADLELKSEIVRALRAERERDHDSLREQALLMAEAAAEMHERAVALSLLVAEHEPGSPQHAAEQLAAASADIAEYTAARAGHLVLARAPVHVRQFLGCIECTSRLEVHVDVGVPERVFADIARLSRILCQFIERSAETAAAPATVLQVTSSGESDPGAQVELTFALQHELVDHEQQTDAAPAAVQPLKRLRAALARLLCELMSAKMTLTTLTLPFEVAADQAHTGRFRLAALSDARTGAGIRKGIESLAEAAQRSTGAPHAPETDITTEARRNDDATIDMLYLDRQLGSLAPVILERTAPAFIARAQSRMTNLHVALEVEDLKRLRSVAHAFKGSALTVGALSLATLLEAIEKQAEANCSPGPGPIWQVRSMLDRALRALEKYSGEPMGKSA